MNVKLVKANNLSGFSLVEILIVVSLVAILVGTVAFNIGSTSASGRDAKRQSDIRDLQNAIEIYKNRNGRYPEGCNGTGWSGQQGTAFACPGGSHEYIIGLAPTYISRLPRDSRPSTDPVFQNKVGYAYITNTEGTVYKLMAMNSVESEMVDYRHPLKSCDVRGTQSGVTTTIIANNNPDLGGWCRRVFTDVVNSPTVPNNPSTIGLDGLGRCRMAINYGGTHVDSEFPNEMRRFERSYGVWGGFAAEISSSHPDVNVRRAQEIRNTAAVICK